MDPWAASVWLGVLAAASVLGSVGMVSATRYRVATKEREDAEVINKLITAGADHEKRLRALETAEGLRRVPGVGRGMR